PVRRNRRKLPPLTRRCGPQPGPPRARAALGPPRTSVAALLWRLRDDGIERGVRSRVLVSNPGPRWRVAVRLPPQSPEATAAHAAMRSAARTAARQRGPRESIAVLRRWRRAWHDPAW